MPATVRIVVSVLAFGATGAAQGPLVSGGPLAGSAVAFAVDGGSVAGPEATTLVHRNGFTGSPVAFPGVVGPSPAWPGSPNLQAILAQFGGAGLEVDDFSTGRDDVLVDSNGVIAVPGGAWGAFTFSFTNGAVGQANSRLAAEVAEAAAAVPPATVGGVVFSWILPGSFNVPAALIGRVERSHSRRELGLSSVGNPEVDALDTPIVLGFDQSNLTTLEPQLLPFLPTPQRIYFTLSSAAAAAAPMAWWQQAGTPSTPSGATILYVERTSQFAGGWTPPRVFCSCLRLGLSPTFDIDALAYDDANQKLVFSLVGNTPFDQLSFVDLGNDGGPPVPVKGPGNTPVSQAVGAAQGDDIDAVCTLDPQLRTQGWVPDDFGASCGTPRAPFMPALYPVGMNASAFRRFEGGNRFYDTWLLGYPPATGVGPGIAVLLLTLGDTTSPAITATFQVRVPTSAVPGDPRPYSLAVPPAYALVGLPVTFRWFAADSGFVQLAQAHPVKAFL